MSAPEDFRDMYELYALGLLEEPQKTQLEELLRQGSPEANERLQQAMENNAIVLAAVPLIDPPRRLRARVLVSVGARQPRNWGLVFWATAASSLLMVSVYLGSQKLQRESELASLKSQLQQVMSQTAKTNAELARARHVLSFLNSADTRVVTFGPKDPKPPRGRVLLNPDRGVLLIASNLPPAPAGKIYEMWIIRKGVPKPVPSGLFQTDDNGNAIHLREGSVALDAVIAVTLEPEAGSSEPTTPPIFVAAL